jgi:transglutaminase-like putative cysteine protease
MGADHLTYAVSHRTTLRYSESVAPSYNEVRMRPRDRGTQRTLAFALLTSPPAVPRTRVDYFGNYVHRIDIGAPHRMLTFDVEAVVENGTVRRRRASPWDSGILENDPRLEFVLSSPRVPFTPAADALWQRWCADDRSIDALLEVAAAIKREFRYVTGATTVDSGIDELLRGGAGVCQDFTHLFIAMARRAGWPTRYVSGYLGPAGEETSVEGVSHAWAEVCGADGRWTGIDPTHGGPTSVQHLRLAMGRDYGDVAPHRGLFYGAATAEAPEVSVRVSVIEPSVAEMEVRGSALHWQQQQQQQQRLRA